MERDDKMTDILNSLNKGWIHILWSIQLILDCELEASYALTLTQNINFRRPGAPIGTIPITLNTSIQNNGYNPSKNFFRTPNTNTR